MISQSKYDICVIQCKELRKSSNRIIEIVQKVLKATDDLDESQRRYLNAVQEAGYDFRNIVEDLLRLDRVQWKSVFIGALRNELYMRASNMVILTQGLSPTNGTQEVDLHQIQESGHSMLEIIQRLCNRR